MSQEPAATKPATRQLHCWAPRWAARLACSLLAATFFLSAVLDGLAAEIVAPVIQPKRADGAVRKDFGGLAPPTADPAEAQSGRTDSGGRAGARSRRVVDKSKRVGESDRPETAGRPSNSSSAAMPDPSSEKTTAQSRRAASIEAAMVRVREAETRRVAAEAGVREAEERLEKAQVAMRVAESKKGETRAKKTSVALAKIDLRRAEVEYEYRRDELTHLAREVDELRASVTALRFEEEVARYGHPVRTIKDVRPEDVLREVRAAGYGNPREIIYDGANSYRVEGFDDLGRRFVLRYDTATGQFERLK